MQSRVQGPPVGFASVWTYLEVVVGACACERLQKLHAGMIWLECL